MQAMIKWTKKTMPVHMSFIRPMYLQVITRNKNSNCSRSYHGESIQPMLKTLDWRLYHLSHNLPAFGFDLATRRNNFLWEQMRHWIFWIGDQRGHYWKEGWSMQYSNVRRTLSWAVIAMKRTFQAFVFSINFVQVQQSTFRDMAIVDASDDNFSLGFWSSVATRRCTISWVEIMQVANGLMTDKGSHNKWFDCVAEYCDSQMDGHQSHDLRNTIDV